MEAPSPLRQSRFQLQSKTASAPAARSACRLESARRRLVGKFARSRPSIPLEASETVRKVSRKLPAGEGSSSGIHRPQPNRIAYRSRVTATGWERNFLHWQRKQHAMVLPGVTSSAPVQVLAWARAGRRQRVCTSHSVAVGCTRAARRLRSMMVNEQQVRLWLMIVACWPRSLHLSGLDSRSASWTTQRRDGRTNANPSRGHRADSRAALASNAPFAEQSRARASESRASELVSPPLDGPNRP